MFLLYVCLLLFFTTIMPLRSRDIFVASIWCRINLVILFLWMRISFVWVISLFCSYIGVIFFIWIFRPEPRCLVEVRVQAEPEPEPLIRVQVQHHHEHEPRTLGSVWVRTRFEKKVREPDHGQFSTGPVIKRKEIRWGQYLRKQERLTMV